MIQKNKWKEIKNHLKEAAKQKVDQDGMESFLRDRFTLILNLLEELVQEGIDLNDPQTVTNLLELEEALHQIPQHRVHKFDVSEVLEDFEDYVDRFYMILCRPAQNAENSFSCDWLVGEFDYFAENPAKVNAKKLDTYLEAGHILVENGSDMIRAHLATAAEDIGHKLLSEMKLKEGKKVWDFVVSILSIENPRMHQREARLMLAEAEVKTIIL